MGRVISANRQIAVDCDPLLLPVYPMTSELIDLEETIETLRHKMLLTDASQLAEWAIFLERARKDVEDQCVECTRSRRADRSIRIVRGKAADDMTEAQKEQRLALEAEKRQLRKDLSLHLTTCPLALPLTGFWSAPLPVYSCWKSEATDASLARYNYQPTSRRAARAQLSDEKYLIRFPPSMMMVSDQFGTPQDRSMPIVPGMIVAVQSDPNGWGHYGFFLATVVGVQSSNKQLNLSGSETTVCTVTLSWWERYILSTEYAEWVATVVDLDLDFAERAKADAELQSVDDVEYKTDDEWSDEEELMSLAQLAGRKRKTAPAGETSLDRLAKKKGRGRSTPKIVIRSGEDNPDVDDDITNRSAKMSVALQSTNTWKYMRSTEWEDQNEPFGKLYAWTEDAKAFTKTKRLKKAFFMRIFASVLAHEKENRRLCSSSSNLASSST